MNQLKMIWEKQEIPNYPLSKEYRFRKFKEGDELAWIEVCKQGLVDDIYTIKDFYNKFLAEAGVDKDSIFFIINQNDDVVATATARKTNDPTKGIVHMVSVRPDFRGKKLSRPIMMQVMRCFYDTGYESVSLTTDDWRIAAIKIYVDFGFKPILYESDMLTRWEKVLATLSIPEMKAYDIDEKLNCMIKPK